MVLKSASPARLAIIYQSLYLANLLLLPGISFFVLVWLFFVKKNEVVWVNAHLYRAIQLSVLGGLIIAIIPLLIIYLSSNTEASLMIMLIYFITFHAGFVLIGMLNLARAMAERPPFL